MLGSDDMQSSPNNQDIGAEFLLAEFEAIRGFKEQSVAIGDKRVDVFLTLSSGLVAGLGLLSQSDIAVLNFVALALFGVLGLLAIGSITFWQVIDRDILIVDYIRAINRIRAYFADISPQIQPYLLMPCTHTYPRYSWQSSNRRIPMVINSISAGAAAVLLHQLLREETELNHISFALAVFLFCTTYCIQIFIARRIFTRAEAISQKSRTISLYNSHQEFRVPDKSKEEVN